MRTAILATATTAIGLVAIVVAAAAAIGFVAIFISATAASIGFVAILAAATSATNTARPEAPTTATAVEPSWGSRHYRHVLMKAGDAGKAAWAGAERRINYC